MKFVSTAALGLVLALGASGLVVATPAVAAKKEKKAEPAKKNWNLSKEFRAAAAPVEAAVNGKKFDEALAALPALEAVSKTPDEKYILASYRYNAGLGKQDMKQQYLGASGMLLSGGAASTQILDLSNASGRLAFQLKDFRNAKAHFEQAKTVGLNMSDSFIFLAESNFQLNDIPSGLAAAEQAVKLEQAAGRPIPNSWIDRVESVLYKAKMGEEMGKWARLNVKNNPTKENWRNQMINYWDTVRDKTPKQTDSTKLDDNGTLDMFRLLRHNKSLGGEADYREFAELALKKQAPGEAEALIKEGRATSALTPSGLAEYLAESGRKVGADKASLMQEEKGVASMDGRRIANTAHGFLSYGEDAKAIALYRQALTKGGADVDLVNMRLGIALARSGQKADARKSFEAVNGPRKGMAQFWLLWLDMNP